jgi:hypothetical protein
LIEGSTVSKQEILQRADGGGHLFVKEAIDQGLVAEPLHGRL